MYLLWREDFLEWAIEVGYWMFFVLFLLCIYLFICIHFQTRDLGQYPILLWSLTEGTAFGCSPLKSQQTGQVGEKEQLQGSADICSEADFPHLIPRTGIQWGKSFYKQKEGVICRNSAVSPDSPHKIGHRWSARCLLVVFRTAGLQGHGRLVPMSLRPVLRVAATDAMALVWSSRH